MQCICIRRANLSNAKENTSCNSIISLKHQQTCTNTLKVMERPEQDWTNGYAGQYIMEEVRLLLRPYHNIILTILKHVSNLCIKSSFSSNSDFWFHSYIYARY